MKLSDNLSQSEGLMVLRGNVKILDDKGNVELDQDNAITDYFRKILMAKLLNDINSSFSDLEGVIVTGDPGDTSSEEENGFISDIRFGAGSSANIGAKASKTDDKLIAPIPDVLSDNSGPLYINTSIFEGLGVEFNFSDLKIQFSSDLINNDIKTYILGELGIFYSNKDDTRIKKMLTHLYFDPIFFEPDTNKKIIYTIYFY